jgi:calcium-dependent protein kinase
LIVGAYGDVRKAIHKQCGIMRAVKIIDKAKANKEEQERLMNEVAIL